ncbi:MAG: molybdenum cofactor guanylyltransferase MobA [Moraxellaceae bacterium]
MTDLPPCSAIVLAGGQGLRMGGRDKGLVELAGRPLVAHILERLAPQVDDIVINCNRHHARYAAFGWPIASDTARDGGPLQGIVSALPACRHAWALVVPCDSPFLPGDLHARLRAALQGQRLAIAHDGERLQPLFMLLHRSLLPSLTAWLASGQRQVGRWCRQEQAAIARFDNAHAFGNLNTAEDLETSEQRHRQERL